MINFLTGRILHSCNLGGLFHQRYIHNDCRLTLLLDCRTRIFSRHRVPLNRMTCKWFRSYRQQFILYLLECLQSIFQCLLSIISPIFARYVRLFSSCLCCSLFSTGLQYYRSIFFFSYCNFYDDVQQFTGIWRGNY